MYNLHTHTLLSDGALLPSEVTVRYLSLGYRAIAITDHADYSNIKSAARAVLEFTRHWPSRVMPIKVLPGIELTHLPLEQFKPLAKYARSKGIQVVVAHGQTPVEPMLKETNRAALEADIDILAHPGIISKEDAALAKTKGIFLEVTSRKGHREANAYIVKLAKETGAKLILNNDSHAPEDIISIEKLEEVAAEAGLMRSDIDRIYKDVEGFLRKK